MLHNTIATPLQTPSDSRLQERMALYNTIQVRTHHFSVLYFSWTPPHQILQFQEHLPVWKTLPTFSERCKKTLQWVLNPQAQEYTVVIPTKYKDLHGSADCVDELIQVVKHTSKMHTVLYPAIVGPAHVLQRNAASDSIDRIRLGNIHVYVDTFWTVY
jgi:hypothetical protein